MNIEGLAQARCREANENKFLFSLYPRLNKVEPWVAECILYIRRLAAGASRVGVLYKEGTGLRLGCVGRTAKASSFFVPRTVTAV